MRRLVCTCFGLGFLPIAPGTWGSLPIAIIFYLLCACGTPFVQINVLLAGLVVIGSVVCVVYSPASIAATGKKDPGEVVMDEFAGQAVTYMSIAAIAPQHAIVAAVLGFLLFRLFDILKPWPVYKLEMLPEGWGILADDLAAGALAAVCFNLAAYFGLVALAAKALSRLF